MKFIKKLYGSEFVNKFVAEIEGVHTHHRSHSFQRGDENYTYIAGSISLPNLEYPGFLITAGTDYETNNIICLDEFESDKEYELIERAKDLQDEYGDVIATWFGDPINLMSLVNENELYVSSPFDYDQKDAFQLYIARLKTALREGHKTLYLKDCHLLRNNILAFVKEKTAKKFNNPAIYTIGSLIHTIVMLQPWERAYTPFELLPTTAEDYLAYEHNREMNHLDGQLWGVT